MVYKCQRKHRVAATRPEVQSWLEDQIYNFFTCFGSTAFVTLIERKLSSQTSFVAQQHWVIRVKF